MVRARASVRQGLGLRLLDGHEALPLLALEHSERRGQQLTLLAVMSPPARDRRFDGGDQELGRRPFVTRFHRRAADPGEPFIAGAIRANKVPNNRLDQGEAYSRRLR